MSERPLLAEHSAAFCLAVVGFATGGAGIAAAAASAAVLTAVGLDRWASCDAATMRAVRRATEDALDQHPDIPDHAISAANYILKSSNSRLKFEPERMALAVQSGDATENIMTSVFGDLSGEDPGTIAALKITIGAAFDAFRRHPNYREAFTQDMVMALLQEHSVEVEWRASVDSKLDEILRRLGGGSAVLADPEALSLEELQALAANFGEAEGATKAELVGVIETKRQEHEAFVAEINAINEQTAGLGNLKAAAKAAAESLDYAEVETLLARVDEVETEIAAQTKELRADNALLRGRVEEAYRLLSAAADSFGSVGPLEPARKRHDYMQKLFYHGQRHGGLGLAFADRMIQQAIEAASEDTNPEIWAMCQNARGIALRNQGSRTGGEAGAALLSEAVAAYRAALRVRTEADHPVDWAGTQNNLAIALQEQGSRTGGEAGAALLAEAVAAYRAALRVRTEADHPVDWAMTQNNLGIALRNQGSRTGGEAGAALLAEAVAAYRAALRVRTEADHPVDRAGTQNNLAIALQEQGSRTGGEAGAALLAEAVAAYRAALRVRTEADHPVQFAMTMENIALAEEAIATHESCDDPAPHLQAALEAVTAALRVYDPDNMPEHFKEATKTKNRLEAKLAELERGSD